MSVAAPPAPRLWTPKRVLIAAGAARYPTARTIAARAAALGAEVIELNGDRLPSLRESDARRTYVIAKQTLAVVVSPPGQRTLQPIPPSADWQFHLARGCPAHCQYCYLAGSLAGPPITRIYANVDEILAGLPTYLDRGTVTSRSADRAGEGTTFEASCYTDPLAIEHLSGSLAAAIAFFGRWDAAVQLRFTTKFDAVEPLLGLDHRGRTRVRLSVNALSVTRRFEGGTAPLERRIEALGQLAGAGYPIGLTVAPIIPVDGWETEYRALIEAIAQRLDGIAGVDLTVELITHRFTPLSKNVLRGWYPATTLEMDESVRAQKRAKLGSVKYVYAKHAMTAMRAFFEREIAALLPQAKVLYWT